MDFTLEQRESEHPQIKVEEPEPPQINEEPQYLRIKEEPQEPGPSQEPLSFWIKEQGKFESKLEKDQLLLTGDVDSFMKVKSNQKKCSEDVNSSSSLSPRSFAVKKPFSCDICCKNFTGQFFLYAHMQSHTKEFPFFSNVCEKLVFRREPLTPQKRLRCPKLRYPCTTCGRRFWSNRDMWEHMKTHCQEKPYSCFICGKNFTPKGFLLEHMKIHIVGKPYCCIACGKTFTVRSSFLCHMIIHSRENPFSCVTCGTSFNLQGALLEHMKTH